MITSPSNRSMHDTRCLKPGVILNQRYRIEEVIGAGGFGITYKAWDPLLQSHVAIKEYYPSGVATRSPDSSKVCVPVESEKKEYQRGRIRFLKEAQDVARFQSEPNIVSIYDYLEENDTAYMVMEYLHGCTLKQYVTEHGGKLSADFLLHVCLSVTDALMLVHKAGMIHRDISPDNIFVCEDLTIKLIDFGAAKQVYFDLEQTVSVVLKPGYAPPEQYAKKDKQGPWTDIYAFGATLYYAATGEKPEESVSRVLEDSVEAVATKNPEIPLYFSEIIMKAMAVKIEDRYPNVKVLREAVFAGDKQEEKETEIKRQRRYLTIGMLSLLSLFIILTVVFLLGRKSGNQSEQRGIATITDATLTDATLSDVTRTDEISDSGTEAASGTDATEGVNETEDKEASERENIMQVPTQEEQALQEVLNVTFSQSVGVSLDKFEYLPDENKGGEGFYLVDGKGPAYCDEYEGDCIWMSLKYLETLKKNPPGVYDDNMSSFTFKKKDENGSFVTIYMEDGTWGDYDYSVWFIPEYHYSSEYFGLYIPLDDELEDGTYQIYFRLGTNEENETIFQTTVEFTLHRGN